MEKLWSALNERLPWPILNKIIRDNELTTGQGVVKTFEKLKVECNSSLDKMEIFMGLEKNLEQAIWYRDKYLKFFDINDLVKTDLITFLNNRFNNFTRNTNGIGQNYPLPDEELDVFNATQNLPELIKFKADSNGICMVFSTVRMIKVRENIKGQFSGIASVGFVDQYNEVIGVKTEMTQFYDIINIDANRNVIEFRMDNHHDSSLTQLETNYNQLLNKAIAIFGNIIGTLFNRHAHNFYSMLQQLYANSQEGMVKEMAFLTDSDSLKHEKMRYESGIDLRDDGYHKKGKEGVTNMDFYRLGVSWEKSLPLKNTINLAVLGKYYMLKFPSGPYIDSAFVRFCYCESEYNFIFDKIRQYQ